MREILFRGKSINTDEWAFGNLIVSDDGEGYIIMTGTVKKNSYLWIDVDFKTVGQYTGLNDKKDVKIFEGDIVKIYEDSNHEVIYFRGCFGVFSDSGEFWSWVGISFIEDYKTEVIGNIYENPGLMEAE